MELKEEWKVIENHPQYRISNTGKVFSTKTNKLLIQQKNSTGYYRVLVDKMHLFVHRLVANAFVDGHDENHDVVNHMDFNPENNNASNLEWTTSYGNYRYSFDRGRFNRTDIWKKRSKNTQIAMRGKPVRAISPDGSVKEYQYLNQVAEDGHLPGMVCKCCKGERKSHHGLVWEYG